MPSTTSTRLLWLALLVTAAASFGQVDSIPGVYDAVHPDWSDTVTFSDDGTCNTGNGLTGRWSASGRRLTIQWDGQGADELRSTGPGLFASRARGYTLTRRGSRGRADVNVALGRFTAVHPGWSDTVIISPDGTFGRVAGSDDGLWTFNGSKLVLGWTRWDPEGVVLQPNGVFVGLNGTFTLAPQVAPPPPPPESPPPPQQYNGPPIPPPPPAVDESGAVGLFDASNDRWADLLTMSPDHTFRRTRGEGGTWAFDGETLTLSWSNRAAEQLSLLGPGRFASLQYPFSMTRREGGAPPPPPRPAPPPAQVTLTVPSTPYAPFRANAETCPAGTGYVTAAEVSQVKEQLCRLLDKWDIARIEGGGSMDGPGYGCGSRPDDARGLGHALCRPVRVVTAGATPAPVLPSVGLAPPPPPPPLNAPPPPPQFAPPASPRPGKWGAMKVHGRSCPNGYVTVAEARQRSYELCKLLGTWDIARLAYGGAMDGQGYGCRVRDNDPRDLGDSLCRK